MDGYGVSKMKRKCMMNKMMLIAALLVGVSSPAFAVVNPDVNWLEPEQVKAEEQKAPGQGDNPFKEDTLFNLSGTRLTVLIPKGFTWKSGESATCCGDNTNAFFNFWVEKHDKNDDSVRTQFGFQKVENDEKRKANLMKSWEKRTSEDMANFEKSIPGTKSNGLKTGIVTIGEGIRGLAAEWFIINQQGISFRVTQFEIWEGGQRDMIQLIAMVEGTDSNKDPNNQMILKMAQSLRMSRTEANPVW
jgi:hypothetical protein